jgi:hypothetical protein
MNADALESEIAKLLEPEILREEASRFPLDGFDEPSERWRSRILAARIAGAFRQVGTLGETYLRPDTGETVVRWSSGESSSTPPTSVPVFVFEPGE